MEKLQMTDRFIEIINEINDDVDRITSWNYGNSDQFLMRMRRYLDIMVFKLQWKIFEHIRPNGDIDICLDKNIQDKDLLPTYKSIMHSDIPTWREVKDELLKEIPNLNETRNYVQWYKTMFNDTLSNVLNLDDFRNNPNHSIIRRIKEISPDIVTEHSLTQSIDNILGCLNNWVKEFVALMDKWWSGAPEISNQKIELVTSNLKQDQSPFNETSSTLIAGGGNKILVPDTLGNLTKETTEELYKLSLDALHDCTKEEFIYYILHPTLGKLSSKQQGKTFILITALLKAGIINNSSQILSALGKDTNKYAKHPMGNANNKTGGTESLFAGKLEKLLNINILGN